MATTTLHAADGAVVLIDQTTTTEPLQRMEHQQAVGGRVDDHGGIYASSSSFPVECETQLPPPPPPQLQGKDCIGLSSSACSQELSASAVIYQKPSYTNDSCRTSSTVDITDFFTEEDELSSSNQHNHHHHHVSVLNLTHEDEIDHDESISSEDDEDEQQHMDDSSFTGLISIPPADSTVDGDPDFSAAVSLIPNVEPEIDSETSQEMALLLPLPTKQQQTEKNSVPQEFAQLQDQEDSATNGTSSLVETVVEHLVERLCFGPCDRVCDPILESDFMNILSRTNELEENELSVYKHAHMMLWKMFKNGQQEGSRRRPRRPRRSSIQYRRRRVRNLLANRRGGGGGGGGGNTAPVARPSTAHRCSLRTAHSMCESFPSCHQQAPSSFDGEEEDEEDGYDSDPEDLLLASQQCRSESPPSVMIATGSHCDPFEGEGRHHNGGSVEEVLNQTWVDLLWHQESTPCRRVSVWIERGTLINGNNTMIEPRLTWKAQNGNSIQSVNLLHICRIVPLAEKIGMAQTTTSWVVKLISQKTFIFQARTPEQRQVIMDQWKQAVARFATLSVLEDADALLDEFFVLKDDNTTPEPFRRSL